MDPVAGRPAFLTYDRVIRIFYILITLSYVRRAGKDVAKFEEEPVCKGKRKILELVELCYVHKETLRALIT